MCLPEIIGASLMPRCHQWHQCDHRGSRSAMGVISPRRRYWAVPLWPSGRYYYSWLKQVAVPMPGRYLSVTLEASSQRAFLAVEECGILRAGGETENRRFDWLGESYINVAQHIFGKLITTQITSNRCRDTLASYSRHTTDADAVYRSITNCAKLTVLENLKILNKESDITVDRRQNCRHVSSGGLWIPRPALYLMQAIRFIS